MALRGGGVVRSLLGRGIKKCPFRGEWTLKPMSCGAAFVQPFYLLALQRWGEFLELASFLWIFFVWGVFFCGVDLFRGVAKMVGGVGDIYNV